MGYAAEIRPIIFNGGFTYDQNIAGIPENMMVNPSRNIILGRGGWQPRGGTTPLNSTAISGTPRIMNNFDFTLDNGMQFILKATTDGKIYKNYTDTIKTGLTTGKFTSFVAMRDSSNVMKVYWANGVDRPQVWDGVTGSSTDLGSGGLTVPTALTGALAGAGAGNVDDGTHSYKVTFINVWGETSGGTSSSIVTVADKAADGQVSLTSIPTGPTGVTSRKIYRTVAGDTGNHKLLTTLSDNTTTIYTDNTADSSLGADVPTTNAAATLPADWNTAINMPFQFIEHGIKESRKLVAICLKAFYISASNDPDDFSDANVIKVTVDDILTGATEFQDRLLPFSKNQFFILDDTDTDSSLWGLYKAIWKTGCSHWRNVVKTATDIVCFTDTGYIYSIATALEYGDYKIGDLAGPPYYMGDFIRENCKLSAIEDFHIVYDEELRRILFFVVMNGKSQVTTTLPFYVDFKLWAAPLENQSFASGFNASCSTIVTKTPAGNHSKYVYTGDYAGQEWKLAEANNNDDDNPYYMGFHTPRWFFGDGRVTKHYASGWPITKVEGSYSLNINTWISRDGVVTQLPIQTVSLQGNNDVFDTALFDTAVFSGDELLTPEYDIGDIGEYIWKEIYVTGVNQDFFLSGINIDHKVLGAEPQ